MGRLGTHLLRPAVILLGITLGFCLIDGGRGDFFTSATLFSTLESFATVGLVTLGLGLAMLAREFDLSVVGLYSLAGCVAVLTGVDHPLLGVLLGMVLGACLGALQGAVIAFLGLSSVAVTLGGMLISNGMAAVLTENRSIEYGNLDVALGISAPVLGPFSWRSLVVLAAFLVLAGVVAFTRPGRDLIALGSNRRAAVVAGVPVRPLLVALFAFSGACAAAAGSLVSYSLASASPAGLSDVILPAATAAILGGVSLGGGSGRPIGLMMGALSLAVLRAGFNALGAPPFVNDLTMGGVLFLVAILDAPDLVRRLKGMSSSLRHSTLRAS